MIESYDYCSDTLGEDIESTYADKLRSIESLSSTELAYLNEVKDYPDAYSSRLEELGICQKDIDQGQCSNVQTVVNDSLESCTCNEETHSTIEDRQFANEYMDVVYDRLCHNDYTKVHERVNPDGSISFMPSSPECLKANPNCEVTIKGNDIYANTGGWGAKGKEGLNGFIQEVPGKHYILDGGATEYKIDSQGRVRHAEMDYNKSINLPERNGQRDSATERRVVEKKDGFVGQDDGGHLFSREIGGPNESINQVPMERDFQQRGEWREYERHEKEICDEAVANGQKVEITRELEYDGNCKRPETITTSIIIDGIVIEKHTFTNPKSETA